MKKKLSGYIGAINKIIVALLLALSVFSIVSPFFITHYGRSVHLLHYFEIHHTIKRLLSFVFVIVAWKLYKRVSAAWTIVMIVLSVSIFQYLIVYRGQVWNAWFLVEVFCYFVLLLSKNYYCRRMDKYSLNNGLLAYILYAIFVFFNAGLALFKERGMVSFWVCMKQTVAIMLGSDSPGLMPFSQYSFYHQFVFWFSWGCILVGLVLVLTPYISERTQTQEHTERARVLVQLYGQNCSSYLSLEKDKSHLWGQSVEGFAAYGVVQDTLVVLGDPICAPENFSAFLTEIQDYCRKNAYSLLFLNTTGMFLKEYQKLGMGVIKCGDEPRLYLPKYSLAGGKASKVRLNVNHATKAGLQTLEYKPLACRDFALEKEITAVSEEWFSIKKSSELVFTMGAIGFENPMDRRYFYAVNPENQIEGFIVFVPFCGMRGYMADVTRHRRTATRGVMEKILYDAMMVFKVEGIEWGSLAVAPLARLEEDSQMTAKLLHTVYEKMNHIYGFKTLYQTKLKYNPTCWEPSYYVYSPAVVTPAMAYAIIKIQNPLGLLDYIRSFFRNLQKAHRKTPTNPPAQENTPS